MKMSFNSRDKAEFNPELSLKVTRIFLAVSVITQPNVEVKRGFYAQSTGEFELVMLFPR